MSNTEDTGLGLDHTGLPKAPTGPPGRVWPLKKENMGLTWPRQTEFDDSNLEYKLVEPTPLMQEKAMELGGGNPVKTAQEVLFQILVRVGPKGGGWNPRKDRTKLESWWKALGPKGRNMVEASFVRMNTVLEETSDSFLGSSTIEE